MNESRMTSIMYPTPQEAVGRACEKANEDGVIIQAFQAIEYAPYWGCLYIVYIPDDPVFLEPNAAMVGIEAMTADKGYLQNMDIGG